MFFSTFYHACDSGEEEFSFCLVKISVLQFCDFYCGLLAIWVTLIAMANVRASFVSLLHMLGAILLAFGTELNKQSLWVFLAPALTGITIISVSWGMKCRKKKTLYPSKTYLAFYLPLGSVLVMIGLVSDTRTLKIKRFSLLLLILFLCLESQFRKKINNLTMMHLQACKCSHVRHIHMLFILLLESKMKTRKKTNEKLSSHSTSARFAMLFFRRSKTITS